MEENKENQKAKKTTSSSRKSAKGKDYVETRDKIWSPWYTATVAVAIVLSALAVLMVMNNLVYSAVQVALYK